MVGTKAQQKCEVKVRSGLWPSLEDIFLIVIA